MNETMPWWQSLGDSLSVYVYRSWDGFLAQRLFPDAHLVSWEPADTATRVIKGLSRNTRIFFFHLDFSDSRRVPLDRSELLSRLSDMNVAVWNGYYSNLSRRALQSTLRQLGLPAAAAGAAGSPEEILIVKTDPNYGGQAEARLSQSERDRLGMEFKAKTMVGPWSYRILARAELAPELWFDSDVVIERYVSNSEGSFYRAYVSGEVVILVKAFSDSEIKKVNGDERDINCCFTRSELVGPVDEAIATVFPSCLRNVISRFISSVSLKYCAIDIVHDYTEYYIVDVNTTPWAGGREFPEEITSALRVGLLSASGLGAQMAN